jgi:hypothetical protein
MPRGWVEVAAQRANFNRIATSKNAVYDTEYRIRHNIVRVPTRLNSFCSGPVSCEVEQLILVNNIVTNCIKLCV